MLPTQLWHFPDIAQGLAPVVLAGQLQPRCLSPVQAEPAHPWSAAITQNCNNAWFPIECCFFEPVCYLQQ